MSADNSVRKVLHIIHGFGPGGVETWLRETVNYLYKHPELNLQFDFLLTGGVLGIFDQEIKSLGSRIFYSRYSNKSIFKFRSDFRDILKKNNYFGDGWMQIESSNPDSADVVTNYKHNLNFLKDLFSI